MSANYASVSASNTTTTVSTRDWYKIRVTGLRGITVILEWLAEYRDQLVGGYMIDGNAVYFQSQQDATFFNLTLKNDD